MWAAAPLALQQYVARRQPALVETLARLLPLVGADQPPAGRVSLRTITQAAGVPTVREFQQAATHRGELWFLALLALEGLPIAPLLEEDSVVGTCQGSRQCEVTEGLLRGQHQAVLRPLGRSRAPQRFDSPAHVVYKHGDKSSKPRLVIDFSNTVNPAMTEWEFRYDSLEQLLSDARYGSVTDVGTFDFKSGFHHIPMRTPEELGVFHRHRRYAISALPFGMKLAPAVFCFVSGFIAQALRQQGYRCMVYVDDVVVWGEHHECKQALTVGTELMRKMDFKESVEKRQFGHSVHVLGVAIDLRKRTAAIPAPRLRRYREHLHEVLGLLARGQHVRSKVWKSLAGKLTTVAMLHPQGRPRMRGLRIPTAWPDNPAMTHMPQRNPLVVQHLEWWKGALEAPPLPLRLINTDEEVELWSDGSDEAAFAGHPGNESRGIRPWGTTIEFSHSEEWKALSSTTRELVAIWAVTKTISRGDPERPRLIKWTSDSTAMVGAGNKLATGSKDPKISLLLCALADWLAADRLVLTHVPREENEWADRGSHCLTRDTMSRELCIPIQSCRVYSIEEFDEPPWSSERCRRAVASWASHGAAE